MIDWMKLTLLTSLLVKANTFFLSTNVGVIHAFSPKCLVYNNNNILGDTKTSSPPAFLSSSSSFDDNEKNKINWRNSLIKNSNNPNDLETPEQRKRRMELVEQIQKSFYMNETGISKQGDVLYDVPLWRVQWTELPGFQNILNCHVPHYTHMFRKIINGPKPWYFGHIYLPGGSENLDNPDYFLCSENSKAAHTGTLMQISDYKQLDDGRLMLIVQALGKMKVTKIQQHLPFAMATVDMTPDDESIISHYPRAHKIASSELNEEDKADDVEHYNNIWESARVAAVMEGMHWEPFEYRNVLTKECLADGGISPLANFKGPIDIISSLDLDQTIREAFQKYSESMNKDDDSELLQTQREWWGDMTLEQSEEQIQKVFDVEERVWIALDFMIQLLTFVNPNPTQSIPIPTQIIGLIPLDREFPEGFKLKSKAQRMHLENVSVGTSSKSPFVLVDEVSVSSYPKLRRAQRLSFAIWALLDTLLAGYDPAARTRQSVLELGSTYERLTAAERGINAINKALKQAMNKR